MKYLIANQKSLMTKEQAKVFKDNYLSVDNDKLKTIVIPSSTYIHMYDGNTGLQNISPFKNKAYTGEIDIDQAVSLGIKYVLVGHSERRAYNQEKNQEICLKTRLLVEHNIKPILCVGETLEQYKNNEKFTILEKQLKHIIKVMDKPLIAYEPVWAIGTGLIPENDEIEKTISFIKEYVLKETNQEAVVLYGGSVTPDNVEQLERITNNDGYLVGGASNDYIKWNKLVNKVGN